MIKYIIILVQDITLQFKLSVLDIILTKYALLLLFLMKGQQPFQLSSLFFSLIILSEIKHYNTLAMNR